MNLPYNLRHAMAWLRDRIPVPVTYGRWRNAREQQRAIEVLVTTAATGSDALCQRASSYAGIIFSKDRAMQLHALLRSYVRQVVAPCPPLTLLYRASTPAHAAAYEEAIALVRGEHTELELEAREETELGFRGTLLSVLERGEAARGFCLVDDDLFIRPLDFAVFASHDLHTTVPSLRLGRHITHAYVDNRDYPVPALTPADGGLLHWQWAAGEGTWNYPMSVDGNLFDRDELLAMARFLAFRGPYSFDAGMARVFGPLFSLRAGVCFEQARLVNIPWNCVQHEVANRYGSLTEKELLCRWQAGECLDISGLDGLIVTAPHVEVEALFTARK
ncbi:MAG: hypothetical protein GX853_09665 [Chloroflexi bacterium]|nr:hypothetical protein [Chloroflexota bacterium]